MKPSQTVLRRFTRRSAGSCMAHRERTVLGVKSSGPAKRLWPAGLGVATSRWKGLIPLDEITRSGALGRRVELPAAIRCLPSGDPELAVTRPPDHFPDLSGAQRSSGG